MSRYVLTCPCTTMRTQPLAITEDKDTHIMCCVSAWHLQMPHCRYSFILKVEQVTKFKRHLELLYTSTARKHKYSHQPWLHLDQLFIQRHYLIADHVVLTGNRVINGSFNIYLISSTKVIIFPTSCWLLKFKSCKIVGKELKLFECLVFVVTVADFIF